MAGGKYGLVLAAAVGVFAAAPGHAKCSVAKLAELPVTMAGQRPMITASFGARPARFIVDSGAFYSTLSRSSAAEFGVSVERASDGFRIGGVGGDTDADIGRAKDFALAGIPIPHADFVVGGSDTGSAGLIGQNILGLADVEYDLPHGAIRLMQVKDCGKLSLAYWTGGKPFSTVELQPEQGVFKSHTIGTVLVNGVKLKAGFDTGAVSSLITLAAAKRAGITPTSPGVVAMGAGSGLGSRQVATWLAPFNTIDIGGEVISHPKMRMADTDLTGIDMLIGIDFFLTHRVFVSNANGKLYFTYEGGPVFGLNPTGARTAAGERLDLTDTAAAPTDAEGWSRRGAALASNGRQKDALADFDRAVALAPAEPRFLFQRAIARLALGQQEAAAADLDKLLAVAPGDVDARLVRARLRMADDHRPGALDDIRAADRALAPASDRRLEVAGLFSALDDEEAALANYAAWLKLHGQDSNRAVAFNGRCWARALLDRELDAALADCNAALKLAPGNAAFLDSRALVQLRRGRLDDALSDYNAALKASPRNAWSLYARSIAEKRAGKAAAATADRQAALALDPHVGDRAERYKIS